MLKWFVGVLLTILSLTHQTYANDQIDPTSVRAVVPFGSGGIGDTVIRLVSQYISERYGKTIVIENKPGANGILGMQAALNAPADGSTWVVASTSTFSANPSLYRKLPYDPESDFSLLGILTAAGSFMLVRSDSGYQSLKDFVTYANSTSDPIYYGYYNSSSQMPGAVLAQKANIPMVGVPYKQISNAISDLLSGQIQLLFVDSASAESYTGAGLLRAIAVTSMQRLSKHPNLPALVEYFPGVSFEGFLGVAARKTTPQPRKLAINRIWNEAIMSPQIRSRLEDLGFTPRSLSVEECAEFDRSQREKWKEYISAAGIELQ